MKWQLFGISEQFKKAEKIAEKEYEKYKKIQDKLSIENLKQLEEGIKKINSINGKPDKKK